MPLLHLLRQNPVIAAVKDNASLQLAIDSECQFISVLYGNICTISNIVKKIKNAGKYAFIHELSGGQQQRVAIARALASKPAIIFADEPTGNLDAKSSQEVIQLLKIAQRKYHETVIMVTHDEMIANVADRILRIEDGQIIQDTAQKNE